MQLLHLNCHQKSENYVANWASEQDRTRPRGSQDGASRRYLVLLGDIWFWFPVDGCKCMQNSRTRCRWLAESWLVAQETPVTKSRRNKSIRLFLECLRKLVTRGARTQQTFVTNTTAICRVCEPDGKEIRSKAGLRDPKASPASAKEEWPMETRGKAARSTLDEY